MEILNQQKKFFEDLDQIPTMRKWVIDQLIKCNVTDEILNDIKIALSEALTNIFKYAYKDEIVKPIRIKLMVDKLNLNDFIFTGETDTTDYLNNLDLVVLTSKSEGQPFVLLESVAAGVPVVATDVGGCRDVVAGNGDNFGDAGSICSVADAPGIAGAMFELCTNTKLWYQCSQAGRKRVGDFYRKELFLDQYRSLY